MTLRNRTLVDSLIDRAPDRDAAEARKRPREPEPESSAE